MAKKRPFRTLFHLRGPLRLVSDPKTASRQGRQGREEASEEPHAAWRPLRSLREEKSWIERHENQPRMDTDGHGFWIGCSLEGRNSLPYESRHS